MKQDNKLIGQLSETMAADYLTGKGFILLERNFGNKFGEIDIIAQDQDTLVFVEVKAKTGITYGPPEEMITPGKLAKIRHIADLYLKDQKLPCRIDVMAIVLDEHHQLIRLTHYPNVY